ncbi:beta-ketoacyl synthase N-terminal-like domain-containing protein [Capnocytophaga canimorsus]|uniref:beta-ketoacyl synthase N-terminal-like domain-containing protein n=1 Tax=Capnocytophaga canimorsus TaxID=28188 RepID=UPI0037D15286
MKIFITGMGSVSALGNDFNSTTEAYRNSDTYIKYDAPPTAPLCSSSKKEIETLKNLYPEYKGLDPSVLFAIIAARKAVQQAQWRENTFGINIGSSRGATSLFEQHYQYFLTHQKCATLTSPSTTLGNIASWVGQDLKSDRFEMSHSITCSTALHALVNGIAWLKSGMENRFLVGGSEAPLTPFTIAQAQALKIYSSLNQPYPCRSMDMQKQQNTMVLGEGAAVFCLEKEESAKALALITGVGYATEPIAHSVAISADAQCLQKSMTMALKNHDKNTVDVIVTHTPGTLKGDKAELIAIQNVFGTNIPALTNNKWKLGHTYGASGALSLEMAILMLNLQEFFPVPYISYTKTPQKINKILVNAVGFGGNAVSVVLERK